MKEVNRRCPCWNDPCDPEVCNGTVQEFLQGECLKTLHRDMLGSIEWRNWIEYAHATVCLEKWGIELYYVPGVGIRIFGSDAAQVLKDPRIPIWLEECNRKFAQFCAMKEQKR